MKKLLIFLFLFYVTFNLEAKIIQSDTVIVNGTKFLFEKCYEINESTDHPDTLWKVYRIENSTRHYLLKHTIYTKDGDCNSIFRDYGAYEIKGDSIIFTTEFEVERDKNFGLPYRQKQIYCVKDDGKMVLVYDRSEMEDGTLKNNMQE